MHIQSIERWTHDHTFGQDRPQAGERRTLIVIGITGATMAVEIVAGLAYGSMALLADGMHMASHASALIVSAWAYFFTRRRAKDARFNFGTGKVNSLAGFASAVMLALFAVVMAWESVARLRAPVPIQFDLAILVAGIGLLVNGVCMVVLGGHGHSHGNGHARGAGRPHHEHHGAAEQDHDHGHHDGHEHPHPHPHPHDHSHEEAHRHDAAPPPDGGHGVDRHKDHNLWSAYLHVMADAATSVLAILALLAGKYFGQNWLDPFMGIVGAGLVIRWSWGLLRSTSGVLLDVQVPEEIRQAIRRAIESHSDNRISDLHVWAVGPGIHAAEITLVASDPQAPDHYQSLLPTELPLVHVTFEVHRCPTAGAAPKAASD